MNERTHRGRRACRRRGSVLILVVTLLAVLFVLGLGFLAMTRMDRATTSTAEVQTEASTETNAVLQRVIGLLDEDLWGGDALALGDGSSNTDIPDEPWDYPSTNVSSFGRMDDAWLADILPEGAAYDADGNLIVSSCRWNHISNVSRDANFGRDAAPAGVNGAGGAPDASQLEADTDLDGCPDSVWMASPTGRFRYAMRVVDSCGMMNLNTGWRSALGGNWSTSDDSLWARGRAPSDVCVLDANTEQLDTGLNTPSGDMALVSFSSTLGRGGNCYRATSSGADPNGDNRYFVGIVDYSLFLDNPAIRTFYDVYAPQNKPSSNAAYLYAPTPFRAIEAPIMHGYGGRAGPAMPRIAAGGQYGWNTTMGTWRSQIPNVLVSMDDPKGAQSKWFYRMYYTPYSWTRSLRPNLYPQTVLPPPGGTAMGMADRIAYWRNELDTFDSSHLGRVPINYPSPHDRAWTRALTAAIVLAGTQLTQAQIEQLVVNLVDWRDADGDVSRAGSNASGNAALVDTVWNGLQESGSTVRPFGNEAQLFISELAARIYPNNADGTASADNRFAIELCNPYNGSIDVSGWRIRCGTVEAAMPDGTVVPAGGRLVLCNALTDPRESNASRRDWPPRPIPSDGSAPPPPGGQVLVAADLNFFQGTAPTAKNILLRRPQSSSSGTQLAIDQAKVVRIRNASTAATWLTAPSSDTDPANNFHAARGDEGWMHSRDLWFAGPNSLAGTRVVANQRQSWGRANASCWGYNKWGTYFPEWIRNDSWPGSIWPNFANGQSAPIPIPVARPDPTTDPPYDFDTAGLLHYLLLIGPTGSTPITETLTTATNVRDSFVDFSRADRGDARLLGTLIGLDRRWMQFGGAYPDWNGNGTPGPSDPLELRIPGLVNINTAPPHVLRYLNYWMFPSEDWRDPRKNFNASPVNYKTLSVFNFDHYIYNDRKANGPFASVGDLMRVPRFNDPGVDVDNDGGALLDMQINPYNGNDGRYDPRKYLTDLGFYKNTWIGRPNLYDQVAPMNLHERHFLFDRLSNVATTRSDTFLVYLVIEGINLKSASGKFYNNADVNVLSHQRIVAVIDRSRCCYAPGTPQYRPPRIVARAVMTW